MCDEIVLIDSNNLYKNGQRAKDGKTYSRYRYEGKVFTVPSDSPFNTDFINGNVDSIKLLPTERDVVSVDEEGNETTAVVTGMEFDSHVSFSQTERRAEHKSKIRRFEVIANAPVSEDLLASLLSS